MTYFDNNLKASIKLKREEEIALFGDYAAYDHRILINLEKKEVKDLQTHTEILTLKGLLKAQVRDYPEIVNIYPVLERYKSC